MSKRGCFSCAIVAEKEDNCLLIGFGKVLEEV
jgi:hypothetical protein